MAVVHVKTVVDVNSSRFSVLIGTGSACLYSLMSLAKACSDCCFAQTATAANESSEKVLAIVIVQHNLNSEDSNHSAITLYNTPT